MAEQKILNSLNRAWSDIFDCFTPEEELSDKSLLSEKTKRIITRHAELYHAVKSDLNSEKRKAIQTQARNIAGEMLTFERVTKRECEIILSVAQGLNNAEIARLLNITICTVKAHLVSIYQKLGLSGRFKLISWYYGGGGLELVKQTYGEVNND